MSFVHKLLRRFGWEAPLSDLKAGQTAPEFTLKSLDGKEHSLAQLRKNGPVVLAFFKVSCPVCQYTFPFLQRLAQRYAGDGVSVIGISQDDARSTTDFNHEYGATFPTLLDGPGYPASNAYGLTNVPTIFLVAPDGALTVSGTGFSKGDLETIATELAQYRKTQLVPFFRADEQVPAFKPG